MKFFKTCVNKIKNFIFRVPDKKTLEELFEDKNVKKINVSNECSSCGINAEELLRLLDKHEEVAKKESEELPTVMECIKKIKGYTDYRHEPNEVRPKICAAKPKPNINDVEEKNNNCSGICTTTIKDE